MIQKLWDKISNLGIISGLSETDTKNVITASRIAVILSFLNLFILLAVMIILGNANSIPYLVVGEFCYLLIVLILSRGYHKIGRMTLGVYVTFASFVYGTLIIIGRQEFTPYLYYEIKILMMASAVLPLLIFSFRDKLMLYSSLAINVLCLLSFDSVLEIFGKGYFQNGGTDIGYIMAQYIFVQSQIFIILSILFLKSISAKFEKRNEDLIAELSHVNEELSTQNDQLTILNVEVENRNKKITSQSNELTKANDKIKEQAELLQTKNISLESEVEKKNEELTESNVQLEKRNDELEQFSFALSHNLRSPLTSLKGLIKLFREDKENRETITDHIESSVVALDDIIHGLGSVLSIHSNEEQDNEILNLEEEIKKVWSMLPETRHSVLLKEDLSENTIKTVRAYLNSILYNLLSNAVKYSYQNNKSYVRVKSSTDNSMLILQVEDNGMGFNMEKHNEEVFKMYKRFHEGIQGNGIGLYLVKEQVSLLNGTISVESTPKKGTTFTITLPIN